MQRGVLIIVAGLLTSLGCNTAVDAERPAPKSNPTAEEAPAPAPKSDPTVEEAPAPAHGVDVSKPDIATATTGPLRGRVSASGQGVASAQVCAWTQPQGFRDLRIGSPTSICTKTDAQGDYSLSLEAGAYQVVASARGHLAVGTLVAYRSRELRVDVELPPGGALRKGRVLDSAGKPVSGIEVVSKVLVGNREQVATATTTDTSGAFELWADADTHLEFRGQGIWRGPVFRNADGDYVLLPGSKVSGTVLNAAGQPATGVRVVALSDAHTWAVTDDQGRFQLDGLEPGIVLPVALSQEGTGMAKADVGYGEHLDGLEITLEPSGTVRATMVVTNSSRPPPVGCIVKLLAKDGFGSYGTVYSDHDGSIQVSAALGSYLLAPSDCPGVSGFGATKIEISGSDPEGEPAAVELSANRTLRIEVKDSDAQPVVGVEVIVRDEDGEEIIRHGRTDTNGTLDFDRLRDEEYQIAIAGSQWKRKPLRGGQAVSLKLPAVATLDVVSSEARFGQFVEVETTRSTSTRKSWFTTEAVTGLDGIFTIERARVAEQRVKLGQSAGCDAPRCVETTLSAGERKRVELDAIPMIDVRVVDEKGTPIAGALVSTLPRFVEGYDPRLLLASEHPRAIVSMSDVEGRAKVNVDRLSRETCPPGRCVLLAIGEEGYAVAPYVSRPKRPVRLKVIPDAKRPPVE